MAHHWYGPAPARRFASHRLPPPRPTPPPPRLPPPRPPPTPRLPGRHPPPPVWPAPCSPLRLSPLVHPTHRPTPRLVTCASRFTFRAAAARDRPGSRPGAECAGPRHDQLRTALDHRCFVGVAPEFCTRHCNDSQPCADPLLADVPRAAGPSDADVRRTSRRANHAPDPVFVRVARGTDPERPACEYGKPSGTAKEHDAGAAPRGSDCGTNAGTGTCAATGRRGWALRNDPYKAAVAKRRSELVVAWTLTFRAGAASRPVPCRCRAECEVVGCTARRWVGVGKR
jgi:hypothetical protein